MQTDVAPTDLAPDAGTPGARLDAGAIRTALARLGAPVDYDAWRIRVVESTGSTSSDLLAAIRAHGFTRPEMLLAEHQTAGRGRLGRTWSSVPGAGLTMSIALPVARELSALEGVTLVCGLAARDALSRHGVDVRLKWPNDLLVAGRKLGGILVEAHASDATTVLVIGVGINVEGSSRPGTLRPGALMPTDLRACGAHDLERNGLAAGLAAAFATRVSTFASTGFAPFVPAWNAVDALRDVAATLREGDDRVTTGIARGVDAGGALLLEVEGRCRRIVSGDVSLRPAVDR